MADMETVVGHLNDCLEASRRDNSWVFVRKDIVADALALLKEQGAAYQGAEGLLRQKMILFDDAIKRLEELSYSENPNSSDQPEIVRCKDCKYNKRYTDGEDALYGCENGAGLHEPYWFCADGKQSDGFLI